MAAAVPQPSTMLGLELEALGFSPVEPVRQSHDVQARGAS